MRIAPHYRGWIGQADLREELFSRFPSSLGRRPIWATSASVICAPKVMVGLSEADGS